jgi:dolichol-phosphate mannosyltransferase
MKSPQISIVIPVYNEEENIVPLLEEIGFVLNGKLDYEVICVDDGSTDNTPQRLVELAQAQSALRVITHQHNAGQSTALRTGVRAARATWIVTLDGDGQNDPADVPRLWTMIQSRDQVPNLRLVVGQRRRRQDSWLKRISSKIANAVRARLLNDNTPDSGCGLKLFLRETYLDLPYFDHMHRFLPALIQREGGQVLSVEVNHRPRVRGASKYGVRDRLWVGIVDLIGVMWLQRRSRIPVAMEEHR